MESGKGKFIGWAVGVVIVVAAIAIPFGIIFGKSDEKITYVKIDQTKKEIILDEEIKADAEIEDVSTLTTDIDINAAQTSSVQEDTITEPKPKCMLDGHDNILKYPDADSCEQMGGTWEKDEEWLKHLESKLQSSRKSYCIFYADEKTKLNGIQMIKVNWKINHKACITKVSLNKDPSLGDLEIDLTDSFKAKGWNFSLKNTIPDFAWTKKLTVIKGDEKIISIDDFSPTSNFLKVPPKSPIIVKVGDYLNNGDVAAAKDFVSNNNYLRSHFPGLSTYQNWASVQTAINAISSGAGHKAFEDIILPILGGKNYIRLAPHYEINSLLYKLPLEWTKPQKFNQAHQSGYEYLGNGKLKLKFHVTENFKNKFPDSKIRILIQSSEYFEDEGITIPLTNAAKMKSIDSTYTQSTWEVKLANATSQVWSPINWSLLTGLTESSAGISVLNPEILSAIKKEAVDSSLTAYEVFQGVIERTPVNSQTYILKDYFSTANVENELHSEWFKTASVMQ